MLFTKFTSSELTAAIMLSKKFNTILTLAFKCKVSEKTGQKKGRADLKARAGTNQPGMREAEACEPGPTREVKEG